MAPLLKMSERVTEKPKGQMTSKEVSPKRKWRALHLADEDKSVSKSSVKPNSHFSSIGESGKREINGLESFKDEEATSVVSANIKPKFIKSSNQRRKKSMKSKSTRGEKSVLPLQSYVNISPPLMHLHSAHLHSSRINRFSASLAPPSATTYEYTESTDVASSANVGLAGVILAMVSVLFIIFGIAFVYRFRNKYHEDDDIEEEREKKRDPIDVWLTTVEPTFPPSAPMKKKVKNVVCSVHRKISGKPEPDKFIPGCPPHLRYQLKTLMVY